MENNKQLNTNQESKYTTNFELVKQICKNCGNEFDAKIFLILGRKTKPSTVCSVCGEKERKEKEIQEKNKKEYEEKQLKNNWRIDSGIPLRFMDERFETYKINSFNKNIFNVCKDYSEKFPIEPRKDYKSLAIFSKGVWGVGKTHLACSIGHCIIDRWGGDWREHSPIYYVTEPNLFSRIRATYNRNSSNGYSENEYEIYKQLATIPLLIIDDVGKEEVSDPRFVQRVWFTIINERYDNLKPVVLTANLTPDELASHLGGSRNNEASFDRLYEMLCGDFWEVKGDSYRREKYETSDNPAK